MGGTGSEPRRWRGTVFVCECGLQDPADCGKDFDCKWTYGRELEVVESRQPDERDEDWERKYHEACEAAAEARGESTRLYQQREALKLELASERERTVDAVVDPGPVVVEDPGERTWTLRGSADQHPYETFPYVFAGPKVQAGEHVVVVEEGCLRQAEADRNGIDDAFKRWREQAREKQAEAEARVLELETDNSSLRLARDAAEHNRLKDNEHLLARVEALREALEPFAALAAVVDDLGHEDDSTCPHRLNAGDIRRARDARIRETDPDPSGP